jgi:hypothetical protein
MAKQTLLTIVQNILSRMSSDEVNSISDTTESLQVANIVQNKYRDIVAREGSVPSKRLFSLTASGDSTKPTLMYIPADISKVDWLKYYDSDPADGQQVSQFGSYSHDLNLDISSNQNTGWTTSSTSSNTIGTGSFTFTVASGLTIHTGDNVEATSGTNSMFGVVTSYSGTTLVMTSNSVIGSGTFGSWILTNSAGSAPPGYKYVTILPIEQFLDMINKLNPLDSDVRSFTFTENGNNFTFLYKNDIQPSYCTVIQNYYVIFDSYNSSFDNTLQSSKTMCFGETIPDFTLSDTFTPDLDDQLFPLLLNESLALAFYELKQQPHAKAEQEIKRQWSAVQSNKALSDKPQYFDQFPSFGRVPNTGGYGGRALVKLR